VAGSENSGHNGETGNLADDHAGLPAGSVTKHRARSVRAVMTLRLQGQTLVAGPKAASRNAGIPCCVWPRHFWRLRWLASFHGFFESAAAAAASAPNLPGRPEARTSGPLCLERCTDRCLPSPQPTARAKPHPARISDQLEGRTSPSPSTSPQMRRKSSRKRAGKNSGIGRFAVVLTRRSISSAG